GRHAVGFNDEVVAAGAVSAPALAEPDQPQTRYVRTPSEVLARALRRAVATGVLICIYEGLTHRVYAEFWVMYVAKWAFGVPFGGWLLWEWTQRGSMKRTGQPVTPKQAYKEKVETTFARRCMTATKFAVGGAIA